MEINSFSGEYRFLSNFFIEPDATHVEGEYQKNKTLDPTIRKMFDGLSPGKAKRFGKTIELRPDWDQIKDEVMETLAQIHYADVIIDRTKWIRGSKHDEFGSTCLLNNMGNMCCLGFLGKAIGYTDGQLYDVNCPNDFVKKHPDLRNNWPNYTEEHDNTYQKLIKANDRPLYSGREREEKITTLGKNIGVNFVFEN